MIKIFWLEFMLFFYILFKFFNFLFLSFIYFKFHHSFELE